MLFLSCWIVAIVGNKKIFRLFKASNKRTKIAKQKNGVSI